MPETLELKPNYKCILSVRYLQQIQTSSMKNQLRQPAPTKKTQKKQIKRNLLFPKQSWTQEEDDLLLKIVTKYGPHKWSHIAKFIPNRMGKQCRQRWFNHLQPFINKNQWSEDEQWKLFLGHKLLGTKWAKLSKILPGRTDNGIKNHWNSIMKKRIQGYEDKLQIQIKKFPFASLTQNGIISRLLNSQTNEEEFLLSDIQCEQVKEEQPQTTEPHMSLKKSTESDEVSFDHILKRLDKNDQLEMDKLDSYNYDPILQPLEEIKNSYITQKSNSNCFKVANCQKEQKMQSLKTVADKENGLGQFECLLEDYDNIPLPPFLKRLSSMDYKMKFLSSSPYKQL